MVPREETAIAAVVSLGGTGNLEFTDTYNTDQRTSMVTKDVTCAQGQASFMSAADTTLGSGTWISIPACGIGAAQISGTFDAGTSSTAITGGNITTASASSNVKLYVLAFKCVLNGQTVARMALKGQDGGSGATALIDEFVVGYGAILPGCTVLTHDGSIPGDFAKTPSSEATTVHSDASKIKITDAYVNQEIYAASPAGTDETFHCAQAYLDPKTHTFDGAIYSRGQSYDNSGSYISGQDQAILPGIGVDNHRRRLGNTGLVTIKIGFSGPSVQGPQHLLIVEDYQCDAGCTPKITGMPLETRLTSNYWSTVVELTKSDFNSYECGRRGKCDYSTGLCQCFAGYVGDNCNTLTTLV
jgi:hypothetical protein